jgi:hypothetical protein
MIGSRGLMVDAEKLFPMAFLNTGQYLKAPEKHREV